MTLPVTAILDLWSLGHSASQVARMLGLASHKSVTRVVQQARSIGDKRAVLHLAQNGRLHGRPGRMERPPVAIAVPALPRKAACNHGHLRTPETVKSDGTCRECHRISNAAWRARKR